MDDQDDSPALLRQFVRERSEAAFAELVRRFVDLVYSAARRQVKDPGLAEDVTQEVFVTLATKAQSIRDGEALAGWLLVTTRFVALNALRSNERRRRHENEAAAMQGQMRSEHENDPRMWETIGPVLDEAIGRLKREDRDAVVLRYFQGRSVAEVAAVMGISQEAAQKRVSRAVERLRGIFASRGITASEQGLASILSANAVAAAPAMLATKIAGVAFAKATATTSVASSALFGKGTATTLMAANSKIIAASVAGVLLLGITGTIAYQQVTGPGSKSRQVTLAPSSAPATLLTNGMSGPAYISEPVATTGPAVNWMQDFHRVYDLADGENVKFVPQPFIADRLAYCQTYMDAQQMKSMPRGPDVMVFEFENRDLRWRGAMYGNPGDIGNAIGSIGNIDHTHMMIPPRILRLSVKGDWVYRATATTEQRMDALSAMIADLLKQPGGKLVEKSIERDAIVVSGTYDYHALPEASGSTIPSSSNLVYFFRGPFHTSARGNSGPADLRRVLEYLGNTCNRPVVIETTLPEGVLVSWQDNVSRQTLKDQELDSVLENVSKQMSLQLKRGRRMVPTWTWQAN